MTMRLLALVPFLSTDVEEVLKVVFSVVSLVATLYFWLVRANRERVSVAVHAVSGFEGALNDHGVGFWTGKLFLANRSILPTAIVAGRAEVWWNGRWLVGNCVANDDSELPWNLAPSQVVAKNVIAAFDLPAGTERERVYQNQRLRFTFLTVEGRQVREEIQSNVSLTASFQRQAA
jgi:hypothetical protein